MRISRLVIRNFRNFEMLDIPLSEGVTCIVGENNTGKSNLIDAIRMVIDANLSSTRRQLAPEDFPVGTDFTKAIQVLISVELTGFKHPAEEALVFGFHVAKDVARVTYRFRPKQDIREAIKDKTHPGDGLTIDDYRWEIRGGGAIDVAKCTWSDDFGKTVRFEELQQSFLVVFMEALRDVDQRLRQSRASPLGRLLTSADVPLAEQKTLVSLLEDANEQIGKSKTVQKLGTDLTQAFESAAGEAFKMGVSLGMAPPTFNDISRSLNVLLSSGAVSNLTTARNGLGLNNILYISILLHYFQLRVKEAKTAGQLLIIEEPESHLHPQLQRVLFQALSAEPFQTILTTHSTYITSAAPLNSLAVLTNDGTALTSSCVPTKSGKLNEREISDLERYLDATRGTLLYARRVMLVEGPAELFLLPPLIEAILKINLDEIGISVIPIYGVHFAAYAKFFGQDTIKKKCAVVADADLEPSDAIPDGVGDDVPPMKPLLKEIENDYVKVFCGMTTFERELTSLGTLPMFIEASKESGATKTTKILTNALNTLASAASPDDKAKALDAAQTKVLALAKNIGKARFAQIASKYANLATALPQYVIDAVEWLRV